MSGEAWGCLVGEVIVYGYEDEGSLSALVLIKSGDVYGVGTNCLVGGSYTPDFPMKGGEGRHLTNYVKVDVLSGKDFKKIVIGSGFGAALSNSNEVTVWSRPRFVDPEYVVTFQAYSPLTPCSRTCSIIIPHDYKVTLVGGARLSYCDGIVPYGGNESEHYSRCIRVKDGLPRNEPVINFLIYEESRFIFPCHECLEPCTGRLFWGLYLHYCNHCDLLLDLAQLPQYKPKPKDLLPYKIMHDDDIIDVACCGVYICLLYRTNFLVVRSYQTKKEETVDNSDGVQMVALHGGTGNFVYVETFDQNVYRLYLKEYISSLWKLDLPAPLKKLLGGLTTAVALLLDGTVWFLYNEDSDERHSVVITRQLRQSGVHIFSDVAAIALTDVFLVRATENSVIHLEKTNGFAGMGCIEVRFSKSSLRDVLLDIFKQNP